MARADMELREYVVQLMGDRAVEQPLVAMENKPAKGRKPLLLRRLTCWLDSYLNPKRKSNLPLSVLLGFYTLVAVAFGARMLWTSTLGVGLLPEAYDEALGAFTLVISTLLPAFVAGTFRPFGGRPRHMRQIAFYDTELNKRPVLVQLKRTKAQQAVVLRLNRDGSGCSYPGHWLEDQPVVVTQNFTWEVKSNQDMLSSIGLDNQAPPDYRLELLKPNGELLLEFKVDSSTGELRTASNAIVGRIEDVDLEQSLEVARAKKELAMKTAKAMQEREVEKAFQLLG